jgi:hypothetical protein
MPVTMPMPTEISSRTVSCTRVAPNDRVDILTMTLPSLPLRGTCLYDGERLGR